MVDSEKIFSKLWYVYYCFYIYILFFISEIANEFERNPFGSTFPSVFDVEKVRWVFDFQNGRWKAECGPFLCIKRRGEKNAKPFIIEN